MAGRALIDEDVNYRAREQVCLDERARTIAATVAPAAHVGMMRTWLVDQWACTFTTTRQARPSVRNGSIEHFDRRHGTQMRAALAQHLEERAG